ncbi:MAG: alpha amylase C-terminal domain-containing protein [Betaproteobacteria bacterium]
MTDTRIAAVPEGRLHEPHTFLGAHAQSDGRLTTAWPMVSRRTCIGGPGFSLKWSIGVPGEGHYREVFNSDSRHYGGADIGNAAGLTAERISWMGQPCSIVATLPPLAAAVLQTT